MSDFRDHAHVLMENAQLRAQLDELERRVTELSIECAELYVDMAQAGRAALLEGRPCGRADEATRRRAAFRVVAGTAAASVE